MEKTYFWKIRQFFDVTFDLKIDPKHKTIRFTGIPDHFERFRNFDSLTESQNKVSQLLILVSWREDSVSEVKKKRPRQNSEKCKNSSNFDGKNLLLKNPAIFWRDFWRWIWPQTQNNSIYWHSGPENQNKVSQLLISSQLTFSVNEETAASSSETLKIHRFWKELDEFG